MRSMWWIFTILLGLALSRVVISLATISRLRLQRQLPKVYVPVVLWEIFLVLFAAEVWLSAVEYKLRLGSISVPILGALTVIPIGIFILVEFLNYDDDFKEPNSAGTPTLIPQVEQFGRVRKAFFIALASVSVFTIAAILMVNPQMLNADLILPALVTIGALAGYLLPSKRAQTVIASSLISTVIVFIVLEYELLGQLPILSA